MGTIELFTHGQGAVIANQLDKAKSFVLVAMAYFTDERLFNMLIKKAQEGLTVQLILKEDDVNTYSDIDYSTLTSVGGEVCYSKNLHHKFCVIDGNTVLSGSYNWTNQARLNHEDLTLIQNNIQAAAELTITFYKIKDPGRFLRRSILQSSERVSSDTNCKEKRRTSLQEKINLLKEQKAAERNSGSPKESDDTTSQST